MGRCVSVVTAIGLALVGVTCDDGQGGGPKSAGAADTGGREPVGDAFGDATAGDGTTEPIGTPGCGRDPGPVLDGVVEVDGQTRTFVLELPPDYDRETPYPLVFVWHAWMASGSEAQATQRVGERWGMNAIVVYPDGLPEPESGNEGWVTDPGGRDFAFFDRLYEVLAHDLCFDRSRVFTQGFSRGAYMASYLACHRGSLIRGLGMISGGGPEPDAVCEGPVAAILFHGEVDPMVPILQGQVGRDRWRAENGCGDRTRPVAAHPTCIAYQDCLPGYPVVWCVHDGDHRYIGWAAQPIADFFGRL